MVQRQSPARTIEAWGTAGHEITAAIAQMYLFDSTRTTLCSTLPVYTDCHLAPLAAWADKIKWQMCWSSPLHYMNGIGNHLGDHCVFGEQGWMGAPGMNILGGVKNTSMWLQGEKPGTEEALRFFVHFMGDLPMPLHSLDREEQRPDADRALTATHG